MYSLLLVDDEPNILNGLYQNVDWMEIGVTAVYKASLAKEAIEIIRHEHIDLVITDIRMPEMEGTELAAILRRNWPYTKIIFLTGYQEFSYAHSAVSLGVFRYMLKPVLYEDLLQAAREALQELSRELTQMVRLKNMEHTIETLRPVMRERLITNWLARGHLQFLDDDNLLKEYDLPMRHGYWGFLSAVRLDQPASSPNDDLLLSHLAVCDSAADILFPGGAMADFLNSDGVTILAFLWEDEESARLGQTRIVSCMETFQQSLLEAIGKHTTIYWTRAAAVEQLPQVYFELKTRVNQQLLLVPHGIISPEAAGGSFAPMESLQLRPLFSELIAGLHKDRALERLDVIFRELRQLEGANRSPVLQVYHEITGALVSDSLSRGLPLQAWAGKTIDFFESISSVASLEVFHSSARRAVVQYIDYVYASSVTQTQSMVMAVKEAVRQGLAEDLTVASLAEKFAYHPNYLSQTFKQETGLSLQEYIIHERMDAAKRLLSQGLSVGEAGAHVGYANITHFSRIFKKMVGVSPKQYQQSGGQS